MSVSKALSLFSAVTLAAMAAVSRANAEPSRSTCFSNFEPTRVVAHEVQRTEDYRTHAAYRILAGARVFIPAQPALTAEWLHHQLDADRVRATDTSQCPLDVPGANVSVRSGGPGFWVTISAPNPQSAEEVLRRTRRIVEGR